MDSQDGNESGQLFRYCPKCRRKFEEVAPLPAQNASYICTAMDSQEGNKREHLLWLRALVKFDRIGFVTSIGLRHVR